MKKLFLFVLSLLLCFSLSACSAKPDDTVGKFCDALKTYDLETMAGYMKDGNSEFENPFDETDENTVVLLDAMKDCASKITYEIADSQVDGDTANITVNFKYVDISPVLTDSMTEYIQQAFAMAFSGSSEEELANLFSTIFNEKYGQYDPVMVDATVTFNCEKTDDGWKISNISDEFGNVITANMSASLSGLADESSNDEAAQ